MSQLVKQLNLLTERAFECLDQREQRINDYYTFPMYVYEFLLSIFAERTTATRNYLDAESLLPIILKTITNRTKAKNVAVKIVSEFGEEGILSLENFLETYEVGWSANSKKVLEELEKMGLELDEREP